MYLAGVVSPMRSLAFRTWRSLTVHIPAGRIRAFGGGARQIGAVLVVNLDRQPQRWQRVIRELGRFRTSEGDPLTSITRRHSAIDARDGRAVAATADVDAIYRIGDQLYVQPDARLAKCFADDEPIRMTRQEQAVALSHVEVWKSIAEGAENYVLVLEDDVWFAPGAASVIDRAWRVALDRGKIDGGPKLLYLSYSDADGTVTRDDVCEAIFRPVRGLWFLSGYVLSRDGASALLRAMPVVGPVDLWMNYRFAELGALAIASPVIRQRHDGISDNSYSVLPYLARAGIVDADHGVRPPDVASIGPVFAWTAGGERESLAMALSMLGLRVRAFNIGEEPLNGRELEESLKSFDALVDPPLAPKAVAAVVADEHSIIVLEADAPVPPGLEPDQVSRARSAILAAADDWGRSWDALCDLLSVAHPVDAFPAGACRMHQVFRVDRAAVRFGSPGQKRRETPAIDDSPWVLPSELRWHPARHATQRVLTPGPLLAEATLKAPSALFPGLTETFPGNLASFALENLGHGSDGARLVIDGRADGLRTYQSGAFASANSYTYGRFEADIKAASGSGLVTGFFLHRAAPRQEIDIELVGADPCRMLVNVYFNPGDDGTAMGYGYRGSPWWVDLGFDVTQDFHRYAVDWRPGRVAWLVDGEVVHERLSWDPTPIPHLEMRVHANLWAPRSDELAGRIDERILPAAALFRNVTVSA